MTTKKTAHSWSDVRVKPATFDRAGLVSLLQDLYVVIRGSRAHLHARLRLGGGLLTAYGATIDRWPWPDVSKEPRHIRGESKKTIAGYRKASGAAEVLAELMASVGDDMNDLSANARERLSGRTSLSLGSHELHISASGDRACRSALIRRLGCVTISQRFRQLTSNDQNGSAQCST